MIQETLQDFTDFMTEHTEIDFIPKAMPLNARDTLNQMFTTKTPKVNYVPMSEEMQQLLADATRYEINRKKADLWKHNPMTGAKVIAGVYNDRF